MGREAAERTSTAMLATAMATMTKEKEEAAMLSLAKVAPTKVEMAEVTIVRAKIVLLLRIGTVNFFLATYTVILNESRFSGYIYLVFMLYKLDLEEQTASTA